MPQSYINIDVQTKPFGVSCVLPQGNCVRWHGKDAKVWKQRGRNHVQGQEEAGCEVSQAKFMGGASHSPVGVRRDWNQHPSRVDWKFTASVNQEVQCVCLQKESQRKIKAKVWGLSPHLSLLWSQGLQDLSPSAANFWVEGISKVECFSWEAMVFCLCGLRHSQAGWTWSSSRDQAGEAV